MLDELEKEEVQISYIWSRVLKPCGPKKISDLEDKQIGIGSLNELKTHLFEIYHLSIKKQSFARQWKILPAELSEVKAMDSFSAYLFEVLNGGHWFASESILLGYNLV